MSQPTERRLGQLLLQALQVACDQHDLDVARGIDQVLATIEQRCIPGTAERRRAWQSELAEGRKRLHAVEHALRRHSSAQAAQAAAHGRAMSGLVGA